MAASLAPTSVLHPTGSARAVFAHLLEPLAADGRLVGLDEQPAVEGRTGELRRPLLDAVTQRLGVAGLWAHQVEALELHRDGHHVVVATGTGSGKSLCYQLPIAEAALDPIRPSTALVIGPTKALAHDQFRALANYGFSGIRPAVYDGDATPNERTFARTQANVVFTNPEMVHGGLLPNHARWAEFLMRLRLVVIDEMHVFRGVFGSHLAHVLRRLRRVCQFYGTHPNFVLCTATIGEPAELAQALVGQPVRAVIDDAAPKGPRLMALVQPPLDRNGTRFTANSETALLVAALARADHRIIAFCRGRRATELVAAEVQRRAPMLASAVRAYRAGYLAEERREIEDALSDGEIRAVISTSALELGIDIGGLDACVINGFPGTIASTRQQIGRVGRTGQPSLGVLVAGDDQLDQWLVRNPRALFERRPERAVINTNNPFIARPHLGCAAFERPLVRGDERFWDGDTLADAVRDLVEADEVSVRRPHRFAEPRAGWSGRGVPAPRVGLRTGAAGEVRIRLLDDTLVGTVDRARACTAVHPGAVYLHQGRPFLVVSLDLDARLARVVPADGTTTTQPRTDVRIRVTDIDATRPFGPARLHLGRVEVDAHVIGYQTKAVADRRVVQTVALDLPPTRLATRAFWVSLDDETLADSGVAEAAYAGALHAAEHGAIGLLPLFTICDRWDVGGLSTTYHPDCGAAAVFIYDGYPGGAGVADLGWQAADELFGATLDLINGCGCLDGCPSCIQSPKCGNGNDPLDKRGAAAVLATMLGRAVIDLRDASSRARAS